MAETALLQRLQSAGFRVRYDPPDGISISPASALTDDLREAIRENKPLLIEALKGQTKPPRSSGGPFCSICKGRDFWERSPESGGGWVCSRCHPDPRDLVAAWERRSHRATVPVVLNPDGARLLAWALEQGCPELRLRPWAVVAGTAHAWNAFVATASDDDIAAALRAARVTA